ncbi:MAG: DedA family protein [Gemmatimonadota bacterium]|nr:DedA family protein [Gemmatimonadota bacterium]
MNPLTPLLLRALIVATAANSLRWHSDFASLDALSDSLWTYVTLGLSTIVTEELAPIFGGIAAHEGDLQFERVVLAITAGGWAATTALYWAGRVKWDWLRRRFPNLRAAGTVALRVVQRNPWRASLLVRFAFGARLLLPMACGAARVRLPVYLIASLLGAAAWSLIFTLVGYAAGEAAMHFLGRLDRAGEIIGALMVTGVILVFISWQRKRNVRKLLKQRRAERVAANAILTQIDAADEPQSGNPA